jgi:hypothetical protein
MRNAHSTGEDWKTHELPIASSSISCKSATGQMPPSGAETLV